jgi:hypothetical protein
LTVAVGINNAGQISGYFQDAAGYHGFFNNGGVFSTIDVEGATATYAEGINNSGDIVGYYVDASGKTHGFLDTSLAAPEPSTMVLLPSALMFLALMLRRSATTHA